MFSENFKTFYTSQLNGCVQCYHQLCRQCKIATSNIDPETRYYAIKSWWFSLKGTTKEGLRCLEL
jgi:hypothetical protein